MTLFDVSPNSLWTSSETLLLTTIPYKRIASGVAKRLKTSDIWKFGKIKKVSKLHIMIAHDQVFLPKLNFC